MGVWLPTATLAALRLRTAGYALEPLPLTAAELRHALDAAPAADHAAPAGDHGAAASHGASCPTRLISLSQVPRLMMVTVASGRFVALAAAMWLPSGDHEHRRKYVDDGEPLNGAEMVASTANDSVDPTRWYRTILSVRSSDAVAKYWFAGSKETPLTAAWCISNRLS